MELQIAAPRIENLRRCIWYKLRSKDWKEWEGNCKALEEHDDSLRKRKSKDIANYKFYDNWMLARFNMIENIDEKCVRWAGEDICVEE